METAQGTKTSPSHTTVTEYLSCLGTIFQSIALFQKSSHRPKRLISVLSSVSTSSFSFNKQYFIKFGSLQVCKVCVTPTWVQDLVLTILWGLYHQKILNSAPDQTRPVTCKVSILNNVLSLSSPIILFLFPIPAYSFAVVAIREEGVWVSGVFLFDFVVPGIQPRALVTQGWIWGLYTELNILRHITLVPNTTIFIQIFSFLIFWSHYFECTISM